MCRLFLTTGEDLMGAALVSGLQRARGCAEPAQSALISSMLKKLVGREEALFRQAVLCQDFSPEAKNLVNTNSPWAWKWYTQGAKVQEAARSFEEFPEILGVACHQAVLEALKNGRLSLFELHYFFAAAVRRFAQSARIPEGTEWGRPLQEGAMLSPTPLTGSLEPYVEKTISHYLALTKEWDPLQETPSFFKTFLTTVHDPENYSIYNVASENSSPVYVVIHNKESLAYVLLTEVLKSETVNVAGICYDRAGWQVNKLVFPETLSGPFVHPFLQQATEDVRDLLFSRAEEVHAALKTTQNPDQWLWAIGEIKRLLLHAPRVSKGHACLCQMMEAYLLLSRNLFVSEPEKDSFEEFEALLFPENTYHQNYARSAALVASPIFQRLMKKWVSLDSIPPLQLVMPSASYPPHITAAQLTHDVMRFKDPFAREFLFIRGPEEKAHVFFQRYPGGTEWFYRSPATNQSTGNLNEVPWKQLDL